MATPAYPDPALTDGHATLRAWTMDDLECVREASTDQRIPEGTTVPAEYSESAGRAFVERQWARQTNGDGLSLAISDNDGRAVGLIVLMQRPQRDVVGVGYWVVPSARGHRYAGRAVRLLSDWALDRAGLRRVEAWVEPHNELSQRVLLGSGFELEGRLRSFLVFGERRADALVFSRISPTNRTVTAPQRAG